MVPQGWLKPSLVLPRVAAASPEELVRAVAALLGQAAGLASAQVEAALLPTIRGEGFSIGSGVAIPHTQLDSLSETLVCLATTRDPLPLTTLDGRDPDIFLFILSRPDPHGHLLLLAHLARLTHSRTFLDGLRRARDGDEIVALVHAAELRQAAVQTRAAQAQAAPSAPAPHALILISVSGEALVDALLVALVDQGLGDSCVLEAQSLHEAVAREVPLFAGFRDIFGDPGGRRVILVEADAASAAGVADGARRICEEHRAADARIIAIPIQSRWLAAPPVEPRHDQPSGGH